MSNAVIFDCDGVLVDSEKWSCGAWLPVLARRGIQTDLEEIETFIGRSDAALLDYFESKGGPTWERERVLAERETAYFEAASGNLHAFAGLEGQINALLNSPAGRAYVAYNAAANITFATQLTFNSSDGVPSVLRLREFARQFMGE